MVIDVYRSGGLNESFRVENSSEIRKRLVGEDIVFLKAQTSRILDLQIGDSINVHGQDFYLNTVPKWVKQSNNHYIYDITFEGQVYDLGKVVLMDNGKTDFYLTGNAEFFIDLILANANRTFSGWIKGAIPTTTDKNLLFQEQNCLEALNQVCQEFNLFYSVSGKEITLSNTPLGSSGGTVEYGKGKGLYRLDRLNIDSKNIITRLYAYGAEKNLPSGYRNYSRRLMFAASGSNYLESNVSKYGIIEASKIFNEIYPHRTGTISSLIDETTFEDTGMDFDLNSYLVPGTSAKIHFNTGNLAGYSFEITAYDHTTKQFTIIHFEDDNGDVLPNATIQPQAGDKYVLVDIYLPQTYIDAAETELQTAAQEYLKNNHEPRVKYNLTLDPRFVEENGLSLGVGDTIHVIDSDMGVDEEITIQYVRRNLVNPNSYTVEISETLEVHYISRLIADTIDNRKIIAANDLTDYSKARMNVKTSQELRNMIFDPDGYLDTQNIKPMSIETGMVSVGFKSTQLTLKDVNFKPNYQGDRTKLEISTGSLVHFTIEDTVQEWTLSPFSGINLDDTLGYYIYARCSRSGNTGDFALSTNKYKPDYGNDNWWFLLGVLHTPVDNVRAISLTYGHTDINGKFITTGKIQSSDGSTYFNLDTGEIGGKIVFRSGNTDQDIESLIGNADSKADQALSDAADAQSTADGKIETFFQTTAPGSPSIGDLWFDTDSDKRIYRWNGTSWVDARDSGIVEALDAAAQAQAIADGKVVTFYQTDLPTATGVGDLWIDTDQGNMLFRWNGSVWINIQDEEIEQALASAANAQNTADSKIVTFYQATAPTGGAVGDLWVDTDNDNQLYRWDGSVWQIARDAGIPQAIADANDAWNLADTKILTYFGDSSPASPEDGDLWYNTQADTLYRYTSTGGWDIVSTKGANWDSDLTNKPEIYRIVSRGYSSTTHPVDSGLYDESGTLIKGRSRSYNLVVYDRSTGTWSAHHGYDLYTDATKAGILASDLNSLTSEFVFVLYTYDEPEQNRLTNGLPEAIYRCGGSRAVFGSSKFKRRGAYILIGIGGIGENNGIELYAGDTETDPEAWVEQTIMIKNGNLQLTPGGDDTQVIIDDGVVTAGRIEVGDGSYVKAGITGNGASGSSVRFWAGQTYANRYSAPFRVTDDGVVYAEKANIKTGLSGNRFEMSGGLLHMYNSSGVETIKVETDGFHNTSAIKLLDERSSKWMRYLPDGLMYDQTLLVEFFSSSLLTQGELKISGGSVQTYTTKDNSSSVTLSNSHDQVITNQGASGNINIYLPPTSKIGKIFIISNTSTSSYNMLIKAPYGYTFYFKGQGATQTITYSSPYTLGPSSAIMLIALTSDRYMVLG